MMNVTIVDARGMPLMCDQGDAAASFTWTDTLGRQHYCCDRHNPVSLPGVLPANFTGHAICPTCGK